MVDTYASLPASGWMDRLRRNRRGSVSVMFAAGAIPMIGLVGLAIDFGIWNETNATLSVAANVAAMTAVRIAAAAQTANDANATQEGVTAGQQWFASEVGYNSRIGTMGVKLTANNAFGAYVTVNGGATVTAQVNYIGTVPSVFGFAMFGLTSYPISGVAVAAVTTAPYLNVYMMLDNSSSMQIGATDSDISRLQTMTPCNQVPTPANMLKNAPGAFYPTGPNSNPYNSNNLELQSYNSFTLNGYTGGAQNPVLTPTAIATASPNFYQNFPNTGAATGESCFGELAKVPDPAYLPPNTLLAPAAGPPCAFACHFDNSAPAGAGNDFYGLARSTNGPNPIVLRFDLVKTATNSVINAMQMDNISQLNNLQVGIYSFATSTTRAYPDPSCGSGPTCEAGYDWSTAATDVGGPSNVPNSPDTGIAPNLTLAADNGGDTNFHLDMVSLQGMVTASGDGTKPTTPRKVLFLVTDGMSDTSSNRTYSPVNPTDCSLFKSMGFTVYVVFTPYYPVMNAFYVSYIKQYAEPLQSSPLYTAMQSCASQPSDFISASDGQTLTAALQTFLKQALNSPARFTM